MNLEQALDYNNKHSGSQNELNYILTLIEAEELKGAKITVTRLMSDEQRKVFYQDKIDNYYKKYTIPYKLTSEGYPLLWCRGDEGEPANAKEYIEKAETK